MKYSSYQHSFKLFLAGLFTGLWLRNALHDKKKSGIIVFKNKLLFVYAVILRTFVWFESIYLTSKELKKSLDTFCMTATRRKSSEK